MELNTVKYDREGHVGIITLNRPQVLNAVNDELIYGLLSALDKAKKDTEAKVIVLRGEGRAFCAGADLKQMPKPRTTLEYFVYLEDLQEISRCIYNLGKPTIAAIQGYALGAGLEIAINCDIRIAAEGARLGFPEVDVAATITNGATKLLPKIVGIGKAKELMYTAERIDAREAERLMLVNKVVPPEELDKAAMEMANTIASKDYLVVKLTKLCIDRGMDASFEALLELEALADVVSKASGERKERATVPSERKKSEKG